MSVYKAKSVKETIKQSASIIVSVYGVFQGVFCALMQNLCCKLYSQRTASQTFSDVHTYKRIDSGMLE